MADQHKLSSVWLGILGVGIFIAAEVLRAVFGLAGSATGLVLMVAFTCAAFPRMRGPVYPTQATLRLRD